MQARVLQWLNRLEALSLRERVMLLVGAPLALVVAGELLVFGPAGKQATEARKQIERQTAELKALEVALAAQPMAAPQASADQLIRQRDELLAQIEAARVIMAAIERGVDWGTVVRATVAGTPGLTLTQLKTLPAELVFEPSMVKPVALVSARAGAAPAGANAKAPATGARGASSIAAAPASRSAATGESIYRHRAELTVKGNFATLLGYLQTLQRLPGDLRWDRLQLTVAAYPQASIQLSLHTLSNRPETPFN